MKNLSKTIAILLGFVNAPHADWMWGQFKTPTRILYQPGYFRVQFAEGTPNPENCALSFPGITVTRSLVGDADYKALYATFMQALATGGRMEINPSGCSNGGPHVSMATISN